VGWWLGILSARQQGMVDNDGCGLQNAHSIKNRGLKNP